jgi:hypothetical protein
MLRSIADVVPGASDIIAAVREFGHWNAACIYMRRAVNTCSMDAGCLLYSGIAFACANRVPPLSKDVALRRAPQTHKAQISAATPLEKMCSTHS